jgi:hypothetical protein
MDIENSGSSTQVDNVAEGMFHIFIYLFPPGVTPLYCDILNSGILYVDPDVEGNDILEIVENVGKGPNRLSESPGATLLVVIPKRKTMPVSAQNVANIATECNMEVMKFVPIRSHWSKYKGDAGLLCNYYSKLAVSTAFSPPIIFI